MTVILELQFMIFSISVVVGHFFATRISSVSLHEWGLLISIDSI